MATAVVTGVASFLDAIEHRYELGDKKEIRNFLAERPRLVSVLIDAADQLPGYFPPGTTLALQLARHPESGSRPELILLIQAHLSMTEALTCLDRFDEEWWLDTLSSTAGELTITVWPS